MAIIDKKFIHFKNYDDFISQAGVGSVANITTPTYGSEDARNAVYGQIKGSSIVFIKDTKQIWTHGQLYSCNVDLPSLEDVVRVDEDGEINRTKLGLSGEYLNDNGNTISYNYGNQENPLLFSHIWNTSYAYNLAGIMMDEGIELTSLRTRDGQNMDNTTDANYATLSVYNGECELGSCKISDGKMQPGMISCIDGIITSQAFDMDSQGTPRMLSGIQNAFDRVDIISARHDSSIATSTLRVIPEGVFINDSTVVTEANINEVSKKMIYVTYQELKQLRDSSQLVPGQYYRITDYECTTIQSDSRSANHPFDIIVQAFDESTLSENAQAIQHEGDKYFADAKLEAWKLKYVLDNDASRFAWAKELIIEQPARWSCGWGVLEERYDDGASANYTTATIDGVQKYLYRPSQPTSHLEGKTFCRYEGREMMSFEDASELYFVTRGNPFETGEQTEPLLVIYAPTDRVIAELEVTYDYGETTDGDDETIWNTYFGDELDMKTYGNTIDFNGEIYYSWEIWEDGAILDDWAVNHSPFVISEGTKIVYEGSTDSLYYALDDVVGQYDTEIYDVTDGNHIYRHENEEEGEGALIDTISYTAYIAPREGGKGIIYRMIDEHNNDCPFDFKNMQFLHSDGKWYYTFSHYDTDASLGDYCFDNYLELIQDQYNRNNADTIPLPATMPMLIFNWIYNSSGKLNRGIIKNNVRTPIKKGFIQSYRIDGNTWLPLSGGALGYVEEFYIYSTGQIYANMFQGHAKIFKAGSADKPNVNFYGNTFRMGVIANQSVEVDCSKFAGCVFNTQQGGASPKIIKGGSFVNCYFEDRGSALEDGNVDLSFEANMAIENSCVKIFDKLTINYENTTSSTTPLRFLNIDARGWDRGTSITIPSTFPVNSDYELKVAKNSKGEIKMWCEADLIA